uniref:Uncharacterized protein n=1 Tax=Anguilla anguilla TaxID=7936 RepID=A0A0E9TCU5_ANGAN
MRGSLCSHVLLPSVSVCTVLYKTPPVVLSLLFPSSSSPPPSCVLLNLV